MSDQLDLKTRVASSRRGADVDVSGSSGPSTSSAPHETVYNRTLADRQYNRNIRFARQFREFATGKTPRSPLQRPALADATSAAGSTPEISEIGAAGGGHGRDPAHLARFLNRSQAHRSKDAQLQKWRRIRTFIVVGIPAALAVAAAVTAWHDGIIPGYHAFLGIPTAAWLALAAAVTPAVLLARYLMALLVRLLESVAAAVGLTNVHYILIGVTAALKLVATAGVFEVLVVAVICMRNAYGSGDGEQTLVTLRALGACFVIFAAVDLFKTLSCRLLSLRVNSGDLFDMLQDAIDKEVIMNRLMAKRHTQDRTCTPERTAAIAAARDIPEWAVEPYLNDLYALATTTDQSRFKNMTEEEANEGASHAAEYFWLTLRQDPSSDRLTHDDLLRVLEDGEMTDFVFSAFDIDGDGYVQEHELHTRIQKCYQQRRNVSLTLVDNDEVIHTLESLVGAVLHVLAAFAYLALLGVHIAHLLISLSSAGLAFVFVFGNNLRTVYESLVFLFMIRPYQVGDCIRYNGELHWVRNFGLLTTQFTRFDGCRIWIPNEGLMRSEIANLSQSGKLRVRADFEADAAAITPELCEELAMRLLAMMESPESGHLFCTDFEPLCHIEHLSDPLKYKIGLCYQLAHTAEQYVEVWEANGRVNAVVGAWLRANNIEHCASIQPLYTYNKQKAA